MALSDHSGYPLPSYASTIWLDGRGNLCLAVPSGPDSKAHIISIPLAKCSIEKSDGGSTLGRQMGWQALLEVLKQRAASQERPIRLGDRAAQGVQGVDELALGGDLALHDHGLDQPVTLRLVHRRLLVPGHGCRHLRHLSAAGPPEPASPR